jgi:arabinose-5-phosphate isomerase
MVAGDMLVVGLAAATPFSLERFAANHPGGAIGLSLIKVAERMRKGARVPKIRESASYEQALQEMTRAKGGIVAVTDAKGCLAGVITDGDVRRFVATHRSIMGKSAADGMTRGPKTALEGDTLADALKRMEGHQITALFVIDGANKPVGLLHIHDIFT